MPTGRSHTFTTMLIAVVFAIGIGRAQADNLVQNPGFEDGTTGWYTLGEETLTAPTTMPHTGSRSAYISNRTRDWEGPAQFLTSVLVPGREYAISAWVRLDNASSDEVSLVLAQTDGNPTMYHLIDQGTGSNAEWVQLSGDFSLLVTGTLQELMLYVEGPQPGVNFYVDDVSILELPDWRPAADARIEQYRKRDTCVRVVDDLGRPLPGVSVDVAQTGHRFGFGSAIRWQHLGDTNYTDYFTSHFNWAVPEDEVEWYWNEPTQGVLDYAGADLIAAFCQANGISLRGHAVFYAVEEEVQPWVQALSDSELQAAMQSRVHSVVNRYQSDILQWDVNNEMLYGAFFQDRLGPSIRPWMFQEIHAVDPDVMLFVNEYYIIAGHKTEAYKALIQQLIADGAPLHGIGVQSHFMSPITPTGVVARLDSLSELGLPIWCTEYDYSHPDENVLADELEKFFRTAFSHPSVDGILMWGFWEGAMWRGPDAAIVNLDWTPNAAGQRYEALLAEWTTETTGISDQAGEFTFRGFHGKYAITLTPPCGVPATYMVTLEPGPGEHVFEFLAGCAADLDGDGDVDGGDFALFTGCLLGPGRPLGIGCSSADADCDGDVDLGDLARFQNAFDGF